MFRWRYNIQLIEKTFIVVDWTYVDITSLFIKWNDEEEDHFVFPNETLTPVVMKG